MFWSSRAFLNWMSLVAPESYDAAKIRPVSLHSKSPQSPGARAEPLEDLAPRPRRPGAYAFGDAGAGRLGGHEPFGKPRRQPQGSGPQVDRRAGAFAQNLPQPGAAL